MKFNVISVTFHRALTPGKVAGCLPPDTNHLSRQHQDGMMQGIIKQQIIEI
jgi:hypothetical protein